MTDEQYTIAVDDGAYRNFATDAAGYGIAQWTWGPRKRNLLDYARANHKSIGDLGMQMGFLLYEMQDSFAGCWNMCRTSHDLYALTEKLLYEWENPQEKENNMRIRYGYAQNWMKYYQNWQKLSETETANTGSGGERMTQQQAVEKVLTLARGEIGYHEQGDNWTKYAADLDKTNWYNGAKNGFAWCDVFVDWLFWKSFGDPLGREMICQPTGSAGAGCLYSAQYYKGAGRWCATSPQPGDQIFFTYAPGEYSHTGIVESVSNGTVTTIEGNTSDSVGRRNYPVGSSTIAGYGRPRWDLATGASSSPTINPTPAPTPTTNPSSGYLLRKGMVGGDVKDMQEKLLKLGYDLGRDGADGDFGPSTFNAVVQFQMANGLEIDGIVGPETLAKMNELLSEQQSQTPAQQTQPENPLSNTPQPETLKMIRSGDKGNQVKLAQAALSCQGYSVPIDGMFTGEFEKKIISFQKQYALEADGIIGRETWTKLLDLPIV